MEEKFKIGKKNIIIFLKSKDLISNFYKNNNIGPSPNKIDKWIDYKIIKSKELDCLFIGLGSNSFNEIIVLLHIIIIIKLSLEKVLLLSF